MEEKASDAGRGALSPGGGGGGPRTFRRYIDRYEEAGLEGLLGRRLNQVSHRNAPLDEVMALVERYRSRHADWGVRHFHTWYRRDGGTRSYPWVKNPLQTAGVVQRPPKRGVHRKRRQAAPWPGMMLHQDGRTHEWGPGRVWDLIVTMDDVTNEHDSMFLCEQEGTASSFRGVREVIETHGLFCSLYTDRGSHAWHTPEAGGKVDKNNPTQFGQAMKELRIEMMAAYSPQDRGRSERAFRTHQDRLVKELAAGITDMEAANAYIRCHYLPAWNAQFCRPARESDRAFVACLDRSVLDVILGEHHERVVGADNCVRFRHRVLPIPKDRHRWHSVKAKVRVRHCPDGGGGGGG